MQLFCQTELHKGILIVLLILKQDIEYRGSLSSAAPAGNNETKRWANGAAELLRFTNNVPQNSKIQN